MHTHHMIRVAVFLLTKDPDEFRADALALRNAADLAKKWRNQFIRAANDSEKSLERTKLVKNASIGITAMALSLARVTGQEVNSLFDRL